MSLICMLERHETPEIVIDTIRAIQVNPHLAVHETCSGKWRISHIQSGAYIVDSCCAICAVSLAEHISTLIDFSLTRAEIESAGKAIMLGQIIREFRCPDNCTEDE